MGNQVFFSCWAEAFWDLIVEDKVREEEEEERHGGGSIGLDEASAIGQEIASCNKQGN